MTPTSKPWQFFGKIYCISITSRRDRQKAVKKQFHSVGLQDLVEFILVKKDPENPERGIFLSHMHCLQKGLDAGAKNILVFEDDVCFHGFDGAALAEATRFLNNNPQWDAFFAGAMSGSVKKTTTPVVSRIHYRCLAHAYALNRHFAEEFTKIAWSNIPFDSLLHKQCCRSFAISPMIAFQSNASTDNKTFFIDKTRRFLGGLTFLQKLNEFYQHHKTTIICCHFLFFFLILLMTWKYLRNS